MEAAEIEKVFDYLHGLGIKDKDLEVKILQEINLGMPEIVLRHRLSFWEAQIWVELYIRQDFESGKLRPQLSRLTYIKPIPFEHAVINGVDTAALEHKMKVIDWPYYFAHQITDPAVNNFARKTLEDFWKLSFHKNERGQEIQDILGLKYFPPAEWNMRQFGSMADEYTKSVDFNMDNAQHIHLFYLQASGKLDSLYQQLEKLKLVEDFGLDIQDQLERQFIGFPQDFTVELKVNTPEAFAKVLIPVLREDDGHYSFEHFNISIQPYPSLPEGIYNGVDIQLLERDMQKINWKNDAALFALTAPGGIEYRPDVEAVLEQLDKLSGNKDGKQAADILRGKYLTGSFPETEFEPSTRHYLSSLPAREIQNRDLVSLKAAVNLALGRPIVITEEDDITNWDDVWKQLLPDSQDNKFIFSGFSLSELERQLLFLPVNDKDFYSIKDGLVAGDMVKAVPAGGDHEITIEADPANKTIHVYNEAGMEIPFNFRLESRETFLKSMQTEGKTEAYRQSGSGIVDAHKPKRKGPRL